MLQILSKAAFLSEFSEAANSVLQNKRMESHALTLAGPKQARGWGVGGAAPRIGKQNARTMGLERVQMAHSSQKPGATVCKLNARIVGL